jgi:hypothetical protein
VCGKIVVLLILIMALFSLYCANLKTDPLAQELSEASLVPAMRQAFRLAGVWIGLGKLATADCWRTASHLEIQAGAAPTSTTKKGKAISQQCL